MMDDEPPSTRQRRKPRFRDPQRVWKRLRASLRPFEEDGLIKYRRVLGFGGFGLVVQVDVLKPDGSFFRSVALKTIVSSNNAYAVEALRREIWWAKQFTGCEHLVQLFELSPSITSELDMNDEYGVGDQPIMVMEHLGRGSLHLMLRRIRHIARMNANYSKSVRGIEYIPNRVLWSMFLCLVRACIGIAYPPKSSFGRRGRSIPETLAGVPESQPPNTLVHCDIDPFNIFIAKGKAVWDGSLEHQYCPVVKIGDYGCMIEWDNDWEPTKKSKSLWGKRQYKAPEQFYPSCLTTGLGAHTNVYQIGATMHEIISLGYTPYEARSAEKRTLKSGSTFPTFGWRMLQTEEYQPGADWLKTDRQLRELVCGCMAADSRIRPSLHLLESLVAGHLARLETQAAEERARQSVKLTPVIPGQFEELNKYRVPLGVHEPDEFIHKFYKEYFIDNWAEPDKYGEFWDNPTLSPRPSTPPEDQPPPVPPHGNPIIQP